VIGRRGSLHLVDPDPAEGPNALRQAHWPAEAGRFKAEVLARRLACRAIAATPEARGWDPGRSGGSAVVWMDLGNYAECLVKKEAPLRPTSSRRTLPSSTRSGTG
jgi:hypothetical protein